MSKTTLTQAVRREVAVQHAARRLVRESQLPETAFTVSRVADLVDQFGPSHAERMLGVK